jgi:hypothetical protein
VKRWPAVLLVLTVAILAWLWMQVIHELGHVLGAWATGGNVERVVLHPLAISRTDVSPNPHPRLVVWAGPVIGAAAPISIWLAMNLARASFAWLAQFFAGFCCLANGLYIGVASFDGVGDAGDLLRHGSPIWTLWLFGLVVAPAGLALWNGLGPKFGWGAAAPPVPWKITLGVMAALAITVVLEISLASW